MRLILDLGDGTAREVRAGTPMKVMVLDGEYGDRIPEILEKSGRAMIMLDRLYVSGVEHLQREESNSHTDPVDLGVFMDVISAEDADCL